jgi:hypothetical protein
MDKKLITATATIFTALMLSACGGSDTEGTIVTLENGEQAGVIMTVPQTDETETDPLASVPETSETVETATSAEDGLVVNQTMSAANDFSFTYLGTVITPGEASAPVIEALGTTYDYYEQALDTGSDSQNTTAKVYSYSDLVIVALPSVSGDYIDTVYFKTGNCSTSEGIAFGAPSDTVIATYGENYTSEGDAIVYKSGSIKLSFFFTNGKVSDISYEYEPEL